MSHIRSLLIHYLLTWNNVGDIIKAVVISPQYGGSNVKNSKRRWKEYFYWQKLGLGKFERQRWGSKPALPLKKRL